MSSASHPDDHLLAAWNGLAEDNQTMRLVSADTLEPLVVGLPEAFSIASLPRLAALDAVGAPGEYRVARTLGQGGMGVIRLAEQTSLFRNVAIKTLRTDQHYEGATLDLLREAWITGRLEHPNIIPVHALGQDEHGLPMLVMKMVEGVNWAEALHDPAKMPARLRSERDPLTAHLKILMQVCNAVHFAHTMGIVHRDLKPDNVMLGAFGEVYLVDWGLAVSVIDDGSARLPLAKDIKDVAGTAAYIAPEMAGAHGQAIEARTDVYLLGAILHRLVTGQPRHGGESLMATLINAYDSKAVDYPDFVPGELALICNKATDRERAGRYESAEAFRVAVEDYVEHRDSHRLTESAGRQLATLRSFIAEFLAQPHDAAGPRTQRQPPTLIYKLFAQCRFGFEQALMLWADNDDAKSGVQDVLEVMIDFELHVGDEKAAANLLAELKQRNHEFEQRLAALREALGREAQQIDRFKRIGHDVDLELATGERSVMIARLAVVFGGAPLLNSALVRLGASEYSFQNYFVQFAAISAGAALVVYVMRHKLLKNAINKRLIASVFAMLAGALVMRLLGFVLGLDVAGCTALENGLFAFGILMLALLTDARLWPAALAFLVGAFGAAFVPSLVLEFDGLSNFAALLLIARAWKQTEDSKQR
ncbi:MAG: protein kinase [Bradymonadaceae bacterium]|nr:protein kinase [Lujinxingiaceae bacterium]